MSRIIRRTAAALAASCIVLAPLTSTAQIPGFGQVDDAINTITETTHAVGNLLNTTEQVAGGLGGSSGLSSSSSAPQRDQGGTTPTRPDNQGGISKEQLLVNAEYRESNFFNPKQATLSGTPHAQSFIATNYPVAMLTLTGSYSNISGTFGFDDHASVSADYAIIEVWENDQLVREVSFDRDEIVEFSHDFSKGTEVVLKFRGFNADHSSARAGAITLATPTVR